MNETFAQDVAAASAAYAGSRIREIATMPAKDAFDRLYDLFLDAIRSYADAGTGWVAAGNQGGVSC